MAIPKLTEASKVRAAAFLHAHGLGPLHDGCFSTSEIMRVTVRTVTLEERPGTANESHNNASWSLFPRTVEGFQAHP